MNDRRTMWCFMILIAVAGCKKDTPVDVPTEAERQATLSSVKQINEYPLYTMTYYGDYGFKNYLENQTLPFSVKDVSVVKKYYCTCVAVRDADSTQYFGRNFDHEHHTALLVYTHAPGAYASLSMVFLSGLGYNSGASPSSPENQQVFLTSPYWPVDGINECGVTIGCMSVDKAAPSWSSKKKTLNRMVIVRLVLDYAKNLDEAIQLLQSFNFNFYNDPLHYLLCDASGRSAVVEFLENDVKIIYPDTSWQVSTNTILYGSHLSEIADFQYTNPASWSLWRYAKVCETIKSQHGTLTAAATMNMLNMVSAHFSPPYNVSTMWSIVYNLRLRSMDIVTDRNYSQSYHFDLKNFAGK